MGVHIMYDTVTVPYPPTNEVWSYSKNYKFFIQHTYQTVWLCQPDYRKSKKDNELDTLIYITLVS